MNPENRENAPDDQLGCSDLGYFIFVGIFQVILAQSLTHGREVGKLRAMLKPQPLSDEEPQDEPAMPEGDGPCFDELMMLVFSGPMCFECLGEVEDETEEHDQDE